MCRKATDERVQHLRLGRSIISVHGSDFRNHAAATVEFVSHQHHHDRPHRGAKLIGRRWKRFPQIVGRCGGERRAVDDECVPLRLVNVLLNDRLADSFQQPGHGVRTEPLSRITEGCVPT